MWAGILAVFTYAYACVHHQLFWCALLFIMIIRVCHGGFEGGRAGGLSVLHALGTERPPAGAAVTPAPTLLLPAGLPG